jgi:DNA-binding PadR family transcriptional regulator
MTSKPIKNKPLSSATLHILLALTGGKLHGYGIMKEVMRNSDGHYRLGPGTLYDNLRKLMEVGFVADAPSSPVSRRKPLITQEEDRRFFILTKEGKAALSAEVDRLQNVVSEARIRLTEARTGKA